MSQYVTDENTYQASKAGPAGRGAVVGGVQTGAGNNPSTAAGLLVVGCLVGLALVRRSFRRYL